MLNGARVRRINKTIFIELPKEAQRPIDGGCVCTFCKAHPDRKPMWDTLAVSAEYPEYPGRTDTAWTVHYPEFNK